MPRITRVYTRTGDDGTTGLRLEASMNRLLQFTQDAVEGPAAFAEKRPPNFSGR